MNDTDSIGLGLIGCGAFGQFCLEAFRELPEVRIVAVADTVESLANATGQRFHVPAFTDVESLLGVAGLSIVHVATPPATHYDIVMRALAAGKNILCEKPLATEMPNAISMTDAAADAGLLVPVNFVLRHNAVTEAVSAVLKSGALGQVLGAWLVNCAADSNLPAGHWFWNRNVSGGIFIEHGVHFFDVYRHWLGVGEMIEAHAHIRPGTDQQDRVECVVRHGEAVVHHYHGFDQVGSMDRTEHRILCELGDIRISGWIPLTMTIDAALEEGGPAAIRSACVKSTVVPKGGGSQSPIVEISEEPIASGQSEVSGRGKPRRLVSRLRLTCTPDPDKQAVYKRSVQSLLADQIAAIRDPGHARRVVNTDGLEALAMATQARDAAQFHANR